MGVAARLVLEVGDGGEWRSGVSFNDEWDWQQRASSRSATKGSGCAAIPRGRDGEGWRRGASSRGETAVESDGAARPPGRRRREVAARRVLEINDGGEWRAARPRAGKQRGAAPQARRDEGRPRPSSESASGRFLQSGKWIRVWKDTWAGTHTSCVPGPRVGTPIMGLKNVLYLSWAYFSRSNTTGPFG